MKRAVRVLAWTAWLYTCAAAWPVGPFLAGASVVWRSWGGLEALAHE